MHSFFQHIRSYLNISLFFFFLSRDTFALNVSQSVPNTIWLLTRSKIPVIINVNTENRYGSEQGFLTQGEKEVCRMLNIMQRNFFTCILHHFMKYQ